MADQAPESEEALELLDELILKGRLDDEEQHALRFTAVLQISAHAASQPRLNADDQKLLALLLGRWGFALTDKEEIAVDEFADLYPVTLRALAHVLRWNEAAVEQSLGRLAAAGMIDLQDNEAGGEDGAYTVGFLPVLTELAPSLADLLWREFVDRESYELGCSASFYVEKIDGDIEELREFRTCVASGTSSGPSSTGRPLRT